MKVSCYRKELYSGIQNVSRAVSARSPIPILSNILFKTENGNLSLSASDLEIGIETWIAASIEEEGCTTIPAKLLMDVVSNLPNDVVTLTLDDATQTLKIECASFSVNIKGLDPDDYPTVPTIKNGAPVATVEAKQFCCAIDQVVFAAATNESRPILTGVNIRIDHKCMYLTAADGFRLARRYISLAEECKTDIDDIIVPAKAMREVSRIFAGTNKVSVIPSDNYIMFHTDEVTLISRVIDGVYPNVDQLIPREAATYAVFDLPELQKALKLTQVFAASSNNLAKLKISDSKMMISANAVEVGDNHGNVDCTVDGDNNEMAVNVRYLIDALNAVDTQHVVLEMNGDRTPLLVVPKGTDSRIDNHVQIIMPMTLR